jgi:hypothetical protein
VVSGTGGMISDVLLHPAQTQYGSVTESLLLDPVRESKQIWQQHGFCGVERRADGVALPLCLDSPAPGLRPPLQCWEVHPSSAWSGHSPTIKGIDAATPGGRHAQPRNYA